MATKAPLSLFRLFRMSIDRWNVEIVKFLVDALPADALAVTNEAGNTALHWAALNGHLDVLRLLCPKLSKDDLAIRNAIGRTSLSEAEARGTEKCLECAGYLLAQMEIDDWGGQEGEADEDEHPPQETANGPVADGMNKLSLDERNSRPESTADR
ncbi:hypothetical protein LshimejAT787_0310460 [Lyophyllum shimeji]|uniref:Ankyrin repeat protein n=1 Tax=Lyophyllum shimeji TaxID=47721 RepID=A0A9P3UJA6_LYOSH|nr:hypothetical protein LshimejAT787_0310460 [Lyophyllum shimeji]